MVNGVTQNQAQPTEPHSNEPRTPPQRRFSSARTQARAIVRWVERHGSKLTTIITTLTTVSAILVTVTMLAFVSVHLNLLAGTPAPTLWKVIADFSFKVLGYHPRTTAEYTTAVSVALNGLLVAVTIIFAVQPFFNAFVQQKRVRDQQAIRTYPIHVDGVDDIAIMTEIYKHAEKVVIFSGDFSWLKTESELSRILHEKGDRVHYVSYKSERDVSQRLDDVFVKFKPYFVFDAPVRIKASVVEYHGYKVFLYKTTVVTGRATSKMMCVVTPQGDSRYLLDALSIFASEFSRD